MKAKIAPVFKNRDLLRRIIEILNVDFALRSKEEETELVDFLRVGLHLTLQNTEIFTKTNDLESMVMLSKKLTLRTLNEGQTLFEQGDIGKGFYIILDGSVNGFIRSEELDEFG